MLNLQSVVLLHRHGENDWVEMAEAAPHGVESHDRERAWLKGGRLFRCTTCAEEVMVASKSGDVAENGETS